MLLYSIALRTVSPSPFEMFKWYHLKRLVLRLWWKTSWNAVTWKASYLNPAWKEPFQIPWQKALRKRLKIMMSSRRTPCHATFISWHKTIKNSITWISYLTSKVAICRNVTMQSDSFQMYVKYVCNLERTKFRGECQRVWNQLLYSIAHRNL